ncbi:CBO0543 family protein [Caldalkalibacillus mannanilyticus]|uniref:CBO0543 family protein n=1 Tax=Caldalkalibacillus mannanilyticus TaxID=1418 RepID=UPI0004697619|nr:CBO0543 family protein [Caldalkalibacillus mannanilyticus]
MSQLTILRFFLVLGILCLPTLFRQRPYKYWVTIHLLSAVSNHFIDNFLISKKCLEYPVRLFPSKIKNSGVYDYLICPLFTVWFCQSTYHSNLQDILKESILFTIPQLTIELLAESKTNLIKFKNGWTWIHSAITVICAKLIARTFIEVWKKADNKDTFFIIKK